MVILARSKLLLHTYGAEGQLDITKEIERVVDLT